MNLRPLFASLSLLLLGACASDRYLAAKGHDAFDKGQWAKAAEAFEKDAEKSGSNQLLFMLDWATSLFNKGDYKKATEIFLQAEKIAEIKDYTSISEEVGTLALSDSVRGYKGEDFEKVLINVYLALSYSAMNELEEAQVEARKINLLLNRMITEGQRHYEESPFARYLSAMLWESSGELDDAYIDYKLAYQLDPKYPGLGTDLIYLSDKLGRRDEEREWRTKFPQAPLKKPRNGEGEIVVFFPRGKSPIKIPRDGEGSSLPRFVTRSSPESHARVRVSGYEPWVTQDAMDIEQTSIRYLEDRIGRMMAKKVLGAAVKGAIAYGIGKSSKSTDAGILAFYALLAADRADLRSWRSLPAGIQMARLQLPPGSYDLKVEIMASTDKVLSTKEFPKVILKPSGKTFLIAR